MTHYFGRLHSDTGIQQTQVDLKRKYYIQNRNPQATVNLQMGIDRSLPKDETRTKQDVLIPHAFKTSSYVECRPTTF